METTSAVSNVTNNSEDNQVDSVPSIQPISVTRNEVSVTYEEAEMTRGNNKGWKYPKLNITEENLDTFVAHIGPKIVAKKLDALMKLTAQGWWEDALENNTKEGIVDYDAAVAVFSKLASDFSARGESIPALKLRREELVAAMTVLDTNAPDFFIKFNDMSTEVKEINAIIASKKRKTDEDKD